jgi:hypothetical protein
MKCYIDKTVSGFDIRPETQPFPTSYIGAYTVRVWIDQNILTKVYLKVNQQNPYHFDMQYDSVYIDGQMFVGTPNELCQKFRDEVFNVNYLTP